ncbi:MAG: anthranilate synthase component I, partial [Peptococcaceae bacterium]|nr:anthranilate synthase component I [Peptococcaceae bacterium]
MLFPSEKKYLEFAKKYKNVPVGIRWLSDTETPITIYSKIAQGHVSFLLESVEGGEKLGRYSLIGFDPIVTLSCSKGVTTISKKGEKEYKEKDPFIAIKSILEEYQVPELPDMPRFYGGAVGYLGYDLVRHLEVLPDSELEETGVPDSIMIIPKVSIILDHIKHSLMILVNTQPGNNPVEEYSKVGVLINEILNKLSTGKMPEALKEEDKNKNNRISSNVSKDDFMAKVDKAKEYIRSGDILQVVLSRRIDQEFTGDPFSVYRRLRRNNPSPYLYFLNLGEVALAGSSPEMLIRVEDRLIETRPIAGTRSRGANSREDDLLAADLLADKKECAEHLMLVDLGRNDVGKVSKPGEVRVPQFMEVEKYSHVMHLVSSVTG